MCKTHLYDYFNRDNNSAWNNQRGSSRGRNIFVYSINASSIADHSTLIIIEGRKCFDINDYKVINDDATQNKTKVK